jgi:hypothetical protein
LHAYQTNLEGIQKTINASVRRIIRMKLCLGLL